MRKPVEFFVYFIQSLKNRRIYCGRSNKKPEARVREHNYGTNKWTSQNGPFRLLYYERYYCETDMIMREKFFKTGFGRRIRDAILKEILKFPPEADQPMAGARAWHS